MTVLVGLSNVNQPDTPTGVTCTLVDDRTVKILWKPINDITLSHYEVYRSSDESTYSLVTKIPVPRIAYFDKGLPTGTYWYKIYGRDDYGFQSCGSTATGMTLGVPTPFSITSQIANACSVTYDMQSFFSRDANNVSIHRLNAGALTASFAGPGGTFLSKEKLATSRSTEKSDRRFNMRIRKVKITGSGADCSYHIEAV